MQTSLNEAIQNISDTLYLSTDSKNFPYFFIVGAGISMPEIPSASNIIEICKSKVKERGDEALESANRKSSAHVNNAMRYYSSWIESAFPNPINRSQFYKSLILKAKISSANLMLAQILQSNKISNTVFTTNFDDKIKQALDIIGTKDVFISENAMDNLVVDTASDEIQIVHVHGTYRFYDSANLEEEINNVSERTGIMSSFQVLRNFLQQKAPIVVGYSGWENDVIMTCIKERINLPVPYNYIWVCFSQNDYNNLPNWLKNNDRVLFVIPTMPENECGEGNIDIDMFLNQTVQEQTPQIPATLFLGKLISQLKILPPKIFVNPYEYYSDMIVKTLPHNEDVLHLKHWAERMKYFAQNDSPVEFKIRELELASIGKDFEKASEIILGFGEGILTAPDVNFLSNSIISELLDNEMIIKTIDTKIKLSNAVLVFAKQYYDILLSSGSLDKLLHNVLSIRFKKSEKGHLEQILDMVYKMTLNCEKLIDVHLTCIGIKSSIAEEDNEKMRLIDELLDKFPEQTKQKSLQYKRCIALFSKCELLNDIEAIKLYNQAEELTNKIRIKKLTLHLLECKAKVALKIKDDEQQREWANECLNSALSLDKSCKLDILKIIGCLTKIKFENLIKLDKVEDKINSLLKVTYECNCDQENCECALLMGEIYLSLIKLTKKDSAKMEYYQNIISLRERLPHQCGQLEITLYKALAELCGLSILIIPDEIKIEYLIKMKKIYETYSFNKSIFNLALETASKLGDREKYLESDLCPDLKISEAESIFHRAFEAYREKNFEESECLFSSLININDSEIKENVFNNLAFMVRRGEASNDKYSFVELIEGVSNDNIFKHMNKLLYFLQNDTPDLEKSRQSYNILLEASQDDIYRLIQCWGDVDFVGEESIVAMIIINSLSPNVESAFDELTPSLMNKFNLENLKMLVS